MKAPVISRFLCPLVAAAVAVLALGGCALKPTPYQPLAEGFGFEETQLQPNLFKVTFRANRATPESQVIDYLYLRSAELARRAGFSHFVVQQDLGKTQVESRPRSRVSIGLGFSSGIRGGFWGLGGAFPLTSPEYETTVSYHLGVFMIRMLTPAEAAKEKEALEVGFMLDSIRKKLGVRAASKN